MLVPTRTFFTTKAIVAAQTILSAALLTGMDISSTKVKPKSPPKPLLEILPKQTGSASSICFVIRRPGEEKDARTSELMKFKLFGTEKDDEGLKEFHSEHFTYPLFKDDGLVIWNEFFGKRPIKLYNGYKDMTQRLKERKMDDNYAGEGFIQGGIFIFDNEGKVRYAYEEEIGKEIEMESMLML
ncbi:predicted protein [Thalassiosira pseudonana CCMP1335]|uniref:Uncharacterized protein n=1 Tax=Thalassiosira pseudonana TaxID=35128 RepID=B8CGJ3_THAPS|nr:predicted protein [Thalassiosira pseudonana CCMP1335]EED87334.1 predicted protein [Thalassiosira pseudonana CCMP1335]